VADDQSYVGDLRAAGLRATRQRRDVLRMLTTAPDCPVTVDQAYALAQGRGLGLTFSTLYNALNDFTKHGLVRRLDVGGRAVYCCNRGDHHHFLDEATGLLRDIEGRQPSVVDLPEPPAGMEVAGVDIFVRLKPQGRK
jgi:Fur family iron response transcriptional regulator